MFSDNAAYFTSQEFEMSSTKSKENDLKKVTEGTLEAHIVKILFQYRITPHSTTALHLQNFCSMQDHVQEWMPYFRIQQTGYRLSRSSRRIHIHDTTAHNRSFSVGQSAVLVQNFAAGERLISPGHIIEPVGPVSFMIELEDGRIFKRHQDHIQNHLTLKELVDIPNNSSDFTDFPCPAAENEQFSSNTQPAVRETVELHQNSSRTGQE